MRAVLASLAFVPLAILALVAWPAAAAPNAATVTVTMYDNDARSPGQGFVPAQGWWGYAPMHVEVKKGDPVLFHNPASNRFPHTVTSIARQQNAYLNELTAGSRFDSTPTQESLVRPGESWTLDTSTLDQGHYAYYCRLHLWMLGSITVLP